MINIEKNILITGGAGFIGINFLKLLSKEKKFKNIFILDKLTYASKQNQKEFNKMISENNFIFFHGDICDKNFVKKIFEENNIEIIINFAAESHVDNSINEGEIFFQTNLMGTINLIEVSKEYWLIDKEKNIYKDGVRFLQISTDEVYGSLDIEFNEKKLIENSYSYGNKKFSETDSLSPSSAYSASKAAADLACLSYYKTHNFPVFITRCTNNFGVHQNTEKFIPYQIMQILKDNTVRVYGSGKNVRDWIYVEDHCKAILFLLENPKTQMGEIYNISTHNEKTNLEIVEILKERFKDIKINFVEDRKGHDKRYALSTKKIEKLGFKIENSENKFLKELNDTINEYINFFDKEKNGG